MSTKEVGDTKEDVVVEQDLTYTARPNLLNWAACILSGLGPWLYGYDSGIISSIVSAEYDQFATYFKHPSSAMTGTVVAIIYAGAVLGSFGMAAADKWGRQRVIIFYSIVSIVGCVLQTAAVDMPMMIVGRLIAGFAMGALTSLATLYQAEISPSQYRGMMTSATKWVNNWGFFSANWIGYGCQFLRTNSQWRVPLAIQIVPPALLAIGMLFVPESPRFLLSVGRVEPARKALARLRSKKEEHAAAIEAELMDMKTQLDWEKENLTSRWVDLVNTKSNLRRVSVGVMVQGMAVFNGIVVINYYMPLIETQLGFSGSKVLLINGLWGMPGPIASFIYMVYGAEHFGRRWPMIICSLLMGALLSITTACAKQFSDPNYANAAIGALGIASMFLFGASFNSSFGPIAWSYPIEILPFNLRAKGAGVSAAATWLSTLVLLQIAPTAFDNIGWKFFLFFVCCNGSNAVLCWFFCPEVKGLELEEIGVLFGDEANVRVVHQEHFTHDPTHAHADRVARLDDKPVEQHIEHATA